MYVHLCLPFLLLYFPLLYLQEKTDYESASIKNMYETLLNKERDLQTVLLYTRNMTLTLVIVNVFRAIKREHLEEKG